MKANRRGFFGMLAATGAATAVSATPAPKPERTLIEYSDAHEGHRATILIDGEDITKKCYRAERWSDGDDIAYCHNLGGPNRTQYLGRVMLRGKIEIRPREDFMAVTVHSGDGKWVHKMPGLKVK